MQSYEPAGTISAINLTTHTQLDVTRTIRK